MTAVRYTLVQKVLHWSIALAVLGALAGGELIHWLENGAFKDQVYFLHKSTGFLILALMVVRVVVRLVHGAPALPLEVPAWQRAVSGFTHFLLYTLLVVMPFVGWAATSAFPAPLPFYGLFDVPALVGADRALSEQLFTIHFYLGRVILVLVAMHIGAALFHGLVKKDGVFQRMT